MTRPAPPDGYEWVSCGVASYGPVGSTIHLIASASRKKDWQTTVCGSTANMRGIWRRPTANSPKPLCNACVAKKAAKEKS